MLAILDSKQNVNGSQKYLLGLDDGYSVETVKLTINYLNPSTVFCISTQVGCPFNCVFCASAEPPLLRNLSFAEMVSQFETVRQDDSSHFRLALMGVGEPLSNYQTSVDFLNYIHHSYRPSCVRTSLSTVGIPTKIRSLSKDIHRTGKFNLQVSFHAPNDSIRRRILPYAARYSIHELVESCEVFLSETEHSLFVSYVLVSGVNDRVDDAKELSKLLSPLKGQVTVKLSSMNDTNQNKGFLPADTNTIDRFCDVIKKNGYECENFVSEGRSIDGGCGQMRGQNNQ